MGTVQFRLNIVLNERETILVESIKNQLGTGWEVQIENGHTKIYTVDDFAEDAKLVKDWKQGAGKKILRKTLRAFERGLPDHSHLTVVEHLK